MAVGSNSQKIKETSFMWEGKDKSGRIIKGQMRAASQTVVSAALRRQGVLNVKVKKLRASTQTVSAKDIIYSPISHHDESGGSTHSIFRYCR